MQLLTTCPPRLNPTRLTVYFMKGHPLAKAIASILPVSLAINRASLNNFSTFLAMSIDQNTPDSIPISAPSNRVVINSKPILATASLRSLEISSYFLDFHLRK